MISAALEEAGRAADVVVTNPFQVSQRSILAFSPGATNCDVTQMEFRRVNRPMYPLDTDAIWSPG